MSRLQPPTCGRRSATFTGSTSGIRPSRTSNRGRSRGEEALVGTPEDVIPAIEEYVLRGGITHFVCALPLGGKSPSEIRAGMELFAREVIPHFR